MPDEKMVLPDAVSDESSVEIRMEVVDMVGNNICALLNANKLTPNEAFATILAVTGAICDATSKSPIDQMEMRARLCNGMLQIGTHVLRNAFAPPTSETPQ